MSNLKLSPGYLIHSAPGRCRFKIPSKRHDAAYFQNMKEDLLNISGIERIDANPLTASVLILYDPQQVQLNDLSAQLETAEHFEPTETETMQVQTVWERATSGLDSFDQLLKESTSGHIDFKSLLFIILFMMAIRQLHQGVIFSAAATLFWYALQVLIKDKNL
jgi:hypothetical protein